MSAHSQHGKTCFHTEVKDLNIIDQRNLDDVSSTNFGRWRHGVWRLQLPVKGIHVVVFLPDSALLLLLLVTTVIKQIPANVLHFHILDEAFIRIIAMIHVTPVKREEEEVSSTFGMIDSSQ